MVPVGNMGNRKEKKKSRGISWLKSVESPIKISKVGLNISSLLLETLLP